ncbi:ribonuclease P protein component [Acinetobacter populi]|jgi:ribonuclease P protein component|uniref:Ribonuclease P protein component n=1 Tax=Acinetobacter populi TaxID=1582270 RepID=A0A1Z9YVW1_9GAMM|nr:ribonuclease P protein component [Acinetobacter populi]MCH4248637.1 ribonuclease P protein component [Acinetobacter populi]OUY06334.1 ribonuclease P protein component [Acinetobacter populi]
MALYSFGKDVRLRCAKDYAGVFNHTLFKVHQPSFLILASLSPDTDSRRIGLVVAKKKVRRAHERNRVKRISRESFRLNQHQLLGLDIVVMPKVGIEQISNAELQQQLNMAWNKLKRLLAKNKLQQNKALSTS